jgi:hypothetical protein
MEIKSSTPNFEDRGFTKRQAFLKYPGEAPEVDYKDGVKFVAGDSFTLKLVKHILGMANTATGGFIVIGFPEGVSKHPEAAAVSDEILASYDVSSLAANIERYKAGTEKIHILVHKDKHPETDQVYPIIEVAGFKKEPFFCKSSAGGILEENALYVRVAGARTIRVASPDEWAQLIDICVDRRQDQIVQRFSNFMREIGLTSSGTVSQTPDAELEKWRAPFRADAKAAAVAAGFKFEGLEITHAPIDPSDKTWTQKELYDAMEKARLRHTGWPIGIVMNTPEYKPKPFKQGVRAAMAFGKDTFDYWFIDEKGRFYFFRAFEEDSRGIFAREEQEDEPGRVVAFDTQIWRIAEGLEHTLSLYKALDLSGATALALEVRYFGINGRSLLASRGSRRHLYPRLAGDSEVEWKKTLSLDTLIADIDQIIDEVCRRLFMAFDFWEPADTVIKGVVTEYRDSQIG